LAAQYRIGPEDVLDISVLDEKDLAARIVVGPDGWIAFPMAGQMMAADKTVSELGQEISARLSDKIRDPVVSVSIAESAGYQVYVVGKVSKPGQFVVSQQIDVLQALALAGGLTPFADQNDIKVLRQRGASGQANQVFPFDYTSIKRGQNLRQNIILQSGDVVVVP
jgi:polysaccharide export outer membrane protein